MKRTLSLLVVMCFAVVLASAQVTDSARLAQQMEELDRKMQELDEKMKQLDRQMEALDNMPVPPSPPGAPDIRVPGVPSPPPLPRVHVYDDSMRRKVIVINGERFDLDSADADEIRAEVEREMEQLRLNLENEFGDGSNLQIYENNDSVVVNIGKLRLQIDEDKRADADAYKYEYEYKYNREDDADDEEKEKEKKKDQTVEGTFGNIKLGLNNFVYGNRVGAMHPYYRDLEFSTGKSINFNIGVAGIRVRLSEKFFFNTGLGLDVNNYRFRSDSVLKPRVETVQFYSRSEEGQVSKNKLATTYLELPVMFGVKVGKKKSQTFKLSLGARAAYLLDAHTKVKVGDKKEKVRDDFNLTPLRYGLTGQIGVGWVNFYVNYDLTPFFRDGVTPELTPVAAGIVLTGW